MGILVPFKSRRKGWLGGSAKPPGQPPPPPDDIRQRVDALEAHHVRVEQFLNKVASVLDELRADLDKNRDTTNDITRWIIRRHGPPTTPQ
jgi:hypothetical protein